MTEEVETTVVEPTESERIASHLVDQNDMNEARERLKDENPEALSKPLSNEIKIELFFDDFGFVSSFRTGREPTGREPVAKNVFVIRKDELATLIDFLSGRLVKVEKKLGKDTLAFGNKLYLKHYSDQDLMVQNKDQSSLEENAVNDILG